MAFSFYIKPPLTLSSYSPINSRSSQQVNGKVFLGLLLNRHICLSHPFSRLYTVPGGWTWAGHCSMARQAPEGWESSQSPISMWVRRGVSTAMRLLPSWCSADVCNPLGCWCCDSGRGPQPADSITARGAKSFLIATRCCNKSVSGLLFHFGICCTQHYSSSTETSWSIKWGSGRVFQSLYHECSLRDEHSAQLPCPHPACPPLLMPDTLTPTKNIYLHPIWWELKSKPLKERKPNIH